jgi:two-component system invasion response regulator UvrY
VLNMNARVRSASRARLRTLVVDDSSTILHAICSLLEHHKLVEVVGRARSGREAIEKVTEIHPDLVLMDADMPGMSGLRAALAVSQTSPRTRTVVMSMDASPQFRRACTDCGASAVIYKPKFLAELKAWLRDEPVRRHMTLLHERFPRPSLVQK